MSSIEVLGRIKYNLIKGIFCTGHENPYFESYPQETRQFIVALDEAIDCLKNDWEEIEKDVKK